MCLQELKCADDSLPIADIEGAGYGLTLGVHSRIETMVEQVTARLRTGNVYVNRNMIGAVVGAIIVLLLYGMVAGRRSA